MAGAMQEENEHKRQEVARDVHSAETRKMKKVSRRQAPNYLDFLRKLWQLVVKPIVDVLDLKVRVVR
jgi:hypothetical protein